VGKFSFKNAKFGAKNPFGENLETQLKFCPPTVSSVGNLQPSVAKLQLPAPLASFQSDDAAVCDVYRHRFYHMRHAVGCSPSATASEPLWYGGRQCSQSSQSLTPTTPTTVRRNDDDEDDDDDVEWQRFNGDFGLSAARLRIVSRLHRESNWDRSPAPPANSSRRSTDQRSTASMLATASRSRFNGQTSQPVPKCSRIFRGGDMF